jgi:hypothetical protein
LKGDASNRRLHRVDSGGDSVLPGQRAEGEEVVDEHPNLGEGAGVNATAELFEVRDDVAIRPELQCSSTHVRAIER